MSTAGLLMTTSPGVNIAGTVSLLPDPGTTPPLLKPSTGDAKGVIGILFKLYKNFEEKSFMPKSGTFGNLKPLVKPRPRPLNPNPNKLDSGLVNPKPIAAARRTPLNPSIFTASAAMPTVAATTPATITGKNVPIKFAMPSTIATFAGLEKKFKNFIMILPKKSFTKNPMILENMLLIGDTTLLTPFLIIPTPFLLAFSKKVSLPLLLSFSSLLCMSRNFSYSNFSCAFKVSSIDIMVCLMSSISFSTPLTDPPDKDVNIDPVDTLLA